jgi:hypothetical protein
MLFDWENQQVSIYVDNKPRGNVPFFNNEKEKLESANALALYGLSPGGTSKIGDL